MTSYPDQDLTPSHLPTTALPNFFPVDTPQNEKDVWAARGDDPAVLTQRFAGPRIIGPSERAPPPPPSAISFGGTQFTPPSGPLPGPTGPPPPTGGVSLASTLGSNKSPMPGPVGPPPAAARDALGFALPGLNASTSPLMTPSSLPPPEPTAFMANAQTRAPPARAPPPVPPPAPPAAKVI